MSILSLKQQNTHSLLCYYQTPSLIIIWFHPCYVDQSIYFYQQTQNSGHDYLEVETEKDSHFQEKNRRYPHKEEETRKRLCTFKIKVFDTLLYQELVKEVVEDIVYLLQRISFCSERCLQEFSFFLKFPYFFQVRTGCFQMLLSRTRA